MTNRAPIRTVSVIVRAKEDVGADTCRIVLADPDDWALPPFAAGAHLDLHMPNGLVRTYSLCGDPADDHRYVLGIKHMPNGLGGSHYLCKSLRVGDRLGVSLPRGGLDLANKKACIMVAGGIGVTPFLALMQRLHTHRPGPDCRLHLLYRGDYPFAEELAPLVALGRVVLHDTLAHPRPDLATLLGPPREDTLLACCGPESLIDAFERASATWPSDCVHVERFVAAPPGIPPGARAFRLVLQQSGKTMDVPAHMTVLDALRALNVQVDSVCEKGICGACKIKWLQGSPIHQDMILSKAEHEDYMMCCVAHSGEKELVLDI